MFDALVVRYEEDDDDKPMHKVNYFADDTTEIL